LQLNFQWGKSVKIDKESHYSNASVNYGRDVVNVDIIKHINRQIPGLPLSVSQHVHSFLEPNRPCFMEIFSQAGMVLPMLLATKLMMIYELNLETILGLLYHYSHFSTRICLEWCNHNFVVHGQIEHPVRNFVLRRDGSISMINRVPPKSHFVNDVIMVENMATIFHSLQTDAGYQSPTSTGLASYTEDTTLDVQQLLSQIANNPEPLLTPFKINYIDDILVECENLLIQETVNHELILPLYRKLGRLSKKLEFTEGVSTATTIRHTYGLFSICKYIINKGGEILIIESCTGTGEQVVSDLDLRYTLDHKVYDCDYTQARSNGDHLIYIWPEKRQMKKYRNLKIHASPFSVKQVISFNMNDEFFNLKTVTIKKYDQSPREKDFEFADKLVKGVQKLSWEEANHLLETYAENYRDFSQERSSMIQTPGMYTSLENYLKVLTCVSENNYDKARVYEDFRNELKHCLTKSVNQKNLAHNYFSLSHYDRIAESDVRWVQPLPQVARGYTERCPFKRLSLIVQDMDKSHIKVDMMTRMVAKLSEQDTVSYNDIRQTTPTVYDDLAYKIKLERLSGKSGKIDAYKMKLISKFHSKSTINTDWIEMIRGKNQSAKLKGNSESLSELEIMYENYQKEMCSTGTGSLLIDDIDNMIDDVLEDGPTAATTRTIMRKCLNTMKKSKLLSQLAFTEELTQAILTAPRKRKLIHKNVGGVDEQYIVMGLSTIADRAAVVSHNLGPMTFGEFKDVTYWVHGNLQNIHNRYFVKQHISSMTSPLSMSPSQLDWNITVLHKAVAWMALRYEICMSHMPSEIENLPKELVMPLSLTFLNSNTFSQAADQLRYFFVNGVGYTSGVGPLFEKIDWYTPKTCLEKLYILRLFKMSDCLSVAKALNKTDKLVVKSQVKIHESHDLKMTFNVDGYLIAMPDESKSYLSQQHTFNSFYNSRALCIQRYQKTVSEALVIKKQMEARQKYLEVKSWNLSHEGRNIDIFDDPTNEEIMALFTNYDYCMSGAQQFSPCPRVTALGFLATTRKSRRMSELTVADTIKRMYKIQDVHRRLNVSSVMNNRGSVRSSDNSGLVVTKVVTNGKKKEKVTQNSKCYRTVLTLLNNFMKGKKPPSTCNVKDIVPDEKPEVDDLTQLTELVNLPDNLGVIVAWLTNNWAACISKMVHKDQLGAREIAVLNALSRIMCRYVEDIARHIRDVNLSNADYTNLIEVPDKRDIVLNEKRLNDAMKSRYNVYYDSADCSTWGPSMMVHSFYLSLRLRLSSENDTMLRNSLALFGNKVFKIPDEFYLKTKSHPPQDTEKSVVAQVKRDLLTMSDDMGNFEKQILYLEESMHQGILGCASSVLGADAHNLSDYVLKYLFQDIGLNVKTFTTSDDYARVIRWEKGTQGTFKTLKDTLDVHVHIMKTAGIKRNLQKSTISRVYFEFNSEFFTSIGEIRPDIKSRLSFVDYSHDTDPYPVALRAMNQGTEYLRSEGSILGSSWVFLLNNILAMYQNQSRSLWKQLGPEIYKTPLELGGLIKPDVIKASISHQLVPLCNNYGGENNLELAMTIMGDMSPLTSSLTEIEATGEVKLSLPSLSRSGTVHLCKRPSRAVRALEEFLMSADKSIFKGLHQSRYASSIVMSLMACAQRERAQSGESSSAINFMVTQTPSSARLYQVNSKLLSVLESGTKLTRDDLHRIAKTFGSIQKDEYPLSDMPLDFNQMKTDLELYYDTMHHLIPSSMSPVPRIGHTSVRRQTFTNQTYTYDAMVAFELQNLPEIFGGTSKVHPWRYLEAKMSYGNFLNNMTMRKQGFRLVLREKDQITRNFVEILLVSNYMAGCRLHYNFDPTVAPKRPIDSTLVSLLQFLDQKSSLPARGIRASILSPGLRQAMDQGKVAKLDITELMNVLSGDSTYFIRSQSLQQTVLSMLTNCAFADRLVIDPLSLSTGFPESKFKSCEGVITWQRNILSEHGFAGRELIMKEAGHFNHWLWGTKLPVAHPDDSDLDTYYCTDIYENDVFRVKLRPICGFLMLTEYMTSSPLQVLSQTVVESSSIRLYSKDLLTRNNWLMGRLKLKSKSQFLASDTIDYYHAAHGLALDTPEEIESDEEGKAIAAIMEEDSDSDDDDYNLDDLDDLCGSSSEEEKEAESIVSPSSSSSEGEPSAPVSTQSSIRQPEGVLVSLSSSSISKVSMRQLQAAERALGTKLSEGIILTLPAKLGISRLHDEPGVTAIEQLYQMISTLDDIDRIWLEETLDACLLQWEPIKTELEFWSEEEISLTEVDEEFW